MLSFSNAGGHGNMGELLQENSKGGKIIREDYKKRSQVKVFSEYKGKRYIHHSYRFNRVWENFDFPFCSWANLDCCGGWSYDSEYLDTAVQKGKKLYAGRHQYLRTPDRRCSPGTPMKDEALQQFYAFTKSLPDNIFADIERLVEAEQFLYTFICRKGTIADYFDLELVFEFYKVLGAELPQSLKQAVRELCTKEIKTFGGPNPPFDYLHLNPAAPAELITTGLLLGYPIESTVSLLCGY